MSEKNQTMKIIIVMLLMLIVIVTLSFKLEGEQANNDILASILPADGSPVLILQSKVGDDVTPIIHQTWCQRLPYKRYIQDDRVFCYIEVIDDWVVE